MKRKILSVLLSIVMVVSMLPVTAAAAGYSDTDGHWAEEAIERWSDYGVIQGNNGKFNPNNALTRAHMAAILYRLLDLPDAEPYGFADVDEDDWFAPYINACASAGIMLGNNGYANPNSPITRQQAIVMLARALHIAPVENPDLSGYTDANQVAAYAAGYIAAMAEAGIVKGTSETTLSVGANITRAATVTILHRAIDVYVTEDGAVVDAADADGIILVVAEDVEIKNAPAGTIVVIADNVGTVKVNGQKVADDQAYEVPEAVAPSKPSSGSSSSGGSSSGGHSHTYTIEITPADCYNNGVKVYSCSCGSSYEEIIYSTGHSEDNGTVTTPATCYRVGVKTYTCTKDGCGATRTEEIPMTEHHFVNDGDPTGSCGSAQLQKQSCDNADCTATKTVTVGDGVIQHELSAWTQTETTHSRTCTKGNGCTYEEAGPHTFGERVLNGNVGTYTCTTCSYEKTETYLAKIGTEYYTTLSAAVTAAGSGATIEVLANVTEDVAVAADKNVTIDTGDKTVATLNYTKADNVKVKGTGTVTVMIGDKTAAFETAADANGLLVVKSAANETALDVYTLQGLKDFRDDVNGGNKYSGKTVTLMSDIDLNNEAWMPIGPNADDANKFYGTFDGNGKTIKNLLVEVGPSYTAAGFFGALNGTAKNFTIDGATIRHISTGDPTDNGVAVVAGSIYTSGTIEGVTVKNATVEGNRYVGGISGYTYGNVKNCAVENLTLVATPDEVSDGKFDNGDKVGGIAGYFASESVYVVSGNTAKNVTITGYRDVGGIVGSGNAEAVTGNRVEGLDITIDRATINYGDKDVNAAAVVGRVLSGTVAGSNTVENATITITGTFASTLTLTNDVILKDVSVTAASGSAVVINGDVNVTIEGAVSLAGAVNGDGIEVPAESKLTLTGTGSLVAMGNKGSDEGGAGSGIGNAGNSVGTITINDLANLTAEGYGAFAFGIGGNFAENTEFSITNTTIDYVCGGFVQPDFEIDTKYGKEEPTGGAAIGVGVSGKTIVLDGVTIEKAEGGSKAAAIGATFWNGVTIQITDSILENIQGGNASAGIGGSRVSSSPSAAEAINITIENSTVTAKGGQAGAGIGSGYDTHCGEKGTQPMCTINIEDSTINATGGKYAAGIGTGYHNAQLSGEIKDSTITAVSGEKFYKDTYTEAQDIGFGVVDPSREGKDNYSTITCNGQVIRIVLPDGTGKDAEGNWYVFNAKGLETMNKKMADKTAGKNAVVILESDIDFTGYTWTPVDSHADSAFTLKEINGNGHTISNLTVNGQAMFKRFAGSGDVTIKDITFDNATVNSTAINSSILTVQTYQNVLLDNVDVKNSTITGGYKVAPLVATVYNESSSTITLTAKNCDVIDTTVKATSYDFCTAGMVAFVYADDNDKIEFENCTVSNVKLIAPDDSYKAHAAIYTTGSGSLYNEAEGVTVTNVTFEAL